MQRLYQQMRFRVSLHSVLQIDGISCCVPLRNKPEKTPTTVIAISGNGPGKGAFNLLIKLSFPNHETESDLSQFTGNRLGEIDDVRFVMNEETERVDAWFVFEDVVENDSVALIPEGEVYYLAAETGWGEDKFLRPGYGSFFSQFRAVFSPYPVREGKTFFSPPFLPWMINSGKGYFFPHSRDLTFFQDFAYPEKTLPLSVICSDQDWGPGHKTRLEFVRRLKSALGQDIHWFGSGINPVPEKWDALHPYERTIVIENRRDFSLYSEKILDAFLGMSVPIYAGAPNIGEFLPLKKSQVFNPLDLEGSIKMVKKTIEHSPSQEEVEALQDGKQRVLRELHFLRRIATIAKRGAGTRSNNFRETALRSRNQCSEPVASKSLGGHLGGIFKKITRSN